MNQKSTGYFGVAGPIVRETVGPVEHRGPVEAFVKDGLDIHPTGPRAALRADLAVPKYGDPRD